MIRLLNNKLKVIKNSLLTISELEVSRYININNETTQIKYEMIEKLLKDKNIKEYNLLYPSDNKPDIFSLSCVFLLHYLIYYYEHTNKNTYIIQNKKSYSFYYYHANQDK